jgi:spermidine synthase
VSRPLRFGLALGAVMIGATLARTGQPPILYSDRTFFGVQKVLGDADDKFHRLMHGTTLHGIQSTDPELRTEPLSYYHTESPIGKLLTSLPAAEAPHIGVIGLGTGSLACYARSGQQWTFFEIDPVMEQIARDPDLFTFLTDCPGEHEVVLGDARISLDRVPDGRYGVLVVDAFNSDAIPVHLLTREAVGLYMRKLAPGGVVAVHISNRYLDLRPVLANVAWDLNLTSMYGSNQPTLEHLQTGKTASQWVVIARREADLGTLADDVAWSSLVAEPDSRVWTDDFSDVFSVFRWRSR